MSCLSGCVTKQITVCTYDPIYISRDDVLTDGTKRQILILNNNWKKYND